MDSTVRALCHARVWRCGSGTFPKLRSFAIQTERTVQGRIGVVHALGRVFLDRLGEGVQQTPAGRFCKFLMGGILELLEDRHNITGIDRAYLRIVVMEIDERMSRVLAITDFYLSRCGRDGVYK